MTVQNHKPQDQTGPDDAKAETLKSGAKKPFVEPTISHPVDVLEATTFFQAVDSGPTGRPRTGE